MTKSDRLHGLYAITDPTLTPPKTLADQVAAALMGGTRIIQYRDKSDDNAKRHHQAQRLLSLCERYQATLIINDDVELAASIKAHGVHLGLTDTALSEARDVLGKDAIIGATCHGQLDYAENAIQQGADYVAFGRFFDSTTKPGAPPADLSTIGPQLAHLPVPAVAIGGITVANASQLRAAGFAMLAVVADIFSQTNIKAHCEDYAQLF